MEDAEDEDYSDHDLVGELESEDGGSFKPKDTDDEDDDGGEHEKTEQIARAKDIFESQGKEKAEEDRPGRQAARTKARGGELRRRSRG